MGARHCSPTPSDATRTPTRSMTGGTSPAASWAAMTSQVFRPEGRPVHAPPALGGRSRAFRHRHAPVLSSGASRLTRQPPRSPASGAFFCSHRRRRARVCLQPPRHARRPQRRHATGDNRMNTPSTSPRLHLLPVSLRTANAFVLSHHRHHRPVQGAKFALAVTLSDSDLIHGVAIVGRPVARHLDAGSHAAVHRRHAQRLQQALRRGLAGGRALGYIRLLTCPPWWRQPARRRLAADRRARWRRLEPSRPSARRYHLRGAKCA